VKSPNRAIIECGGVGYDANISVATFTSLPAEGAEARLHIYTHVREDQIALFGFAEPNEKRLFEKLLTISGIGPKLAITVLSGIDTDRLVAAIRAGVPGLARLSVERVWSELRRILAAPDPRGAAALMHRTGVLHAVLPEGTEPERLAALVASGAPADPVLRLAALFCGDATTLAERLRFSTAEALLLSALRAAPAPPPGADDATLRRALADVPRDVLVGRVWLAGGDAGLLARLRALETPVFALHGRDLKAAGVLPGPALGALLRELRAWWFAGGCVAGAADLRAELRRRLAGDGAAHGRAEGQGP